MNAPNQPESTALAVADNNFAIGTAIDAAALILGPSFERVQSFAKVMASGAVSVPKHLRGNMGDCMAITIQALGWRMNPFAVAQKTHLSQCGALGYEAQLVSAVLVSTGAIKREPEFEAIGDWSKVLGKVEERQGKQRPDGSEGGKWFAATYTKKDEEGLGVIVRATLAGESSPRELRVMMSQAYPRFSTQWATDPFQQLCYLAVRKWGRLNSPGAILGVYTAEELDGGAVPEKHMGPADVVPSTGAAAATTQSGATPTPNTGTGELPQWPDEAFEKKLPKFREHLAKGKTVDDIVAFYGKQGKFTAKQIERLNALANEKPAQPAVIDNPAESPALTYAQVADRLAAAKNLDELTLAADLIRQVADEGQRKELTAIFEKRGEELPASA